MKYLFLSLAFLVGCAAPSREVHIVGKYYWARWEVEHEISAKEYESLALPHSTPPNRTGFKDANFKQALAAWKFDTKSGDMSVGDYFVDGDTVIVKVSVGKFRVFPVAVLTK